MSIEDDECTSVDKLLACSKREYHLEKQVWVCSWDELRSWKSVTPMGIYKKSKKKNMKAKRNAALLGKGGTFSMAFHAEAFPYRYRFSETGKIAHSSTNVLSYSSPSWRYIVDWRSYSYLERNDPGDKISKVCKNVVNRSHTSLTDYLNTGYRETDFDYQVYRLNPSDLIDEKIASAYNESLTFDMDDYDEEELRQHFLVRPVIKLPVASLENAVLVGETEGGKKTAAAHQEKELSVCIKANNSRPEKKIIKTNHKPDRDHKVNKKKHKKKRRNLRHDYIEIKRMSLPPIDLPTTDSITQSFNKYNKGTDEFPFSIAQMLTSKNKSESNEEKGHGKTNSSQKSYDLYLPTLKYGNYVHLFKDSPKKVRSNVKLPKMYTMKMQSIRSRSNRDSNDSI